MCRTVYQCQEKHSSSFDTVCVAALQVSVDGLQTNGTTVTDAVIEAKADLFDSVINHLSEDETAMENGFSRLTQEATTQIDIFTKQVKELSLLTYSICGLTDDKENVFSRQQVIH